MAVVVPNVATAEECLELADAACEIVQLWKLRPKSWSESSGHCDGWRCLSRVPSIAAAARADAADLECTQPTTGAIDSHASQMIVRVLSLIDAQFQSVVTTLFAGEQLLDLYHSDRLHWASREPTINVYYPGGEFFPHQDHKVWRCLGCEGARLPREPGVSRLPVYRASA
jgi:hypothetical protein